MRKITLLILLPILFILGTTQCGTLDEDNTNLMNDVSKGEAAADADADYPVEDGVDDDGDPPNNSGFSHTLQGGKNDSIIEIDYTDTILKL